MGHEVVHRPARIWPTEIPAGVEELARPPVPSPPPGPMQAVMQVAMPVLGGLGMVVFVFAGRNPLLMVGGLVLVLAMIGGGVGMLVAQRTGTRRRAAMAREQYLAYLEDLREKLRNAARAQSEAAATIHPTPGALLHFARHPARRWERRPGDPDFLDLRIGLGDVPRALRAVMRRNQNPLEEHDAVCQRAAERIVANYTVLHHQPIAVPMRDSGVVSIVGTVDHTRLVARLLIAQLAVSHAPGEVRLALCFAREAEPAWRWTKWLPHCLAPDARGAQPPRYIADSPDKLKTLLRQEYAERAAQVDRSARLGSKAVPRDRLVIVVDEAGLGERPDLRPDDQTRSLADLGICVVHLVGERRDEPGQVDVRVSIGETAEVAVLRPASNAPVSSVTRLDVLSVAEAETLARALAPLRLDHGAASAEEPLVVDLDLPRLLGGEAGADPPIRWQPRPLADFLRVPIGVTADGSPLLLDLKENALGGMGPHGICIGATGSGKSELLRTLVLALAMTHPPERLAFVLVDYKGGAAFAGLGELPHTAGFITNLSDGSEAADPSGPAAVGGGFAPNAELVDRMYEALSGEMRRRQQILMAAGNLPNVVEYNRRLDAGLLTEPLPNLLVVVDEFAELLDAKPEFIGLFDRIGRIGRSIGMHLLLSAQRLEEGRLRGLESCISYRLGLRTFTAAESRAVLGVPDAHQLPPVAGSAYLKVDPNVFQRFKAAYVSGPYRQGRPAPAEDRVPITEFPTYYREPASPRAAGEARPETAVGTADAPSVLSVAVSRLAARGGNVHQVWLSPLPTALPLDAVAGRPYQDERLGLRVARQLPLRVPLGLLDLPAEQRQETWTHDFSGSGGHLAILGAPQSGKSMLLRTLILSAALTHKPGEVAFHCVDFGGGTLSKLADLPHVGTVCGRLDPQRVRRTVAEAASQLEERERVFARRGIDSAETMRAMWHAGELPELPYVDLFLVIDNYMTIKNDYEDLGDLLAEIAARGLGYGIHLVLTAARWHDLRGNLQTAIGGRIELRLNDPMDSIISRKQVELLRSDQRGRCVTIDARMVQIALPRVDAIAATADLSDALTWACGQINRSWPGPRVPPVRLLPERVEHARLAPPSAGGRVVLGIGENDLRPVELDLFGADGHLLVFGEGGAGKTSVLMTLIRSLMAAHTDDDVVFAIFDPRRTLLGFVPEAYVGAYAGTPDQAAGLAAGLAQELKARLPPDDITPEQLRARAWWRGPQMIVVVDDYELLVGSGNPLTPLLEYLPQARDLGLHVMVARHSGGVGRALFEPFLQRLRELGAAGLVLRGDRQEGQLWPGVWPSSQPNGRGHLVRRGHRPLLVQVAHLDEQPQV
ncbi:type VII secretion protein EccCa [Herbidospora daliensis]|uniref:type VII secretion protein EccCa n=1 Tax=Herbidospora daliensis TaxID=295585 RepID=UPI0007C66BA2|nr:type VII secretion protein EccCa [Herbidospora daliensis]